MAVTIDPTVPADSESPRLGANRIRSLSSLVLQWFGYTGASAATVASPPFSFDAAGNATLNGQPLLVNPPVVALGIANKGYVDSASLTGYSGSTAGTNTYTVTFPAAPASLAALKGIALQLFVTNGNTSTTVTLAPNGLTATAVQKWVNGSLVNLAINDIPNSSTVILMYDGTVFELVSVANQIQAVGLPGPRNLYSTISAGTTAPVTADTVVTRNNTLGTLMFFNTLNSTVDISVAGPILNGRDIVGAFGATATVHVYAITGVAQTSGLIASTTAPSGGGPVLPTGYTNWAYLFSVILSGGNFQACQVVGNKVYYTPLLATSLFAGQASVETQVTITGLVPTIAQEVMLQIEGSVSTSAGVNFNQGVIRWRAVSGADSFVLQPWAYSLGTHAMQQDLQITLPNLGKFFYLWAAPLPNAVGFGASAWVLGYTVPNNA